MKLDNSQMAAWHKCPWYWRERYVNNIEAKRNGDALAFGTRMHHLLESRRLGKTPDLGTEPFEAEAQVMLAAYEQQYPVEPFDVVTAEQYFELQLPGSQHVFNGKIDSVVRVHDSGMLNIFESKTEKRGGKRNTPDAWAARPQVGLYQWAGEQLYGEKIDQIILDVLTRQSPAGREPCMFHRQNLQRAPEQIAQALRDITWVADQMERMLSECSADPYESWPADKEQCVQNNWKCDFHELHVIGRSPEVLEARYQPAEQYLSF